VRSRRSFSSSDILASLTSPDSSADRRREAGSKPYSWRVSVPSGLHKHVISLLSELKANDTGCV
jgi:hypothetical protein